MIAAELRGGNKPSLNEALGWIGSRVDDIYGANVGRLEDVWIDPGTGAPRWLLVKEGRFGGRTTLVPFEDATAGAGHVWVPYEREIVREAPEIEPGAPLTHQVEATLRSHYTANSPPAVTAREGSGATSPQPGSTLGTATIRPHGAPAADPASTFGLEEPAPQPPLAESPEPAEPRPTPPQPRRPVLREQPSEAAEAPGIPPYQLPTRPPPPIAAPSRAAEEPEPAEAPRQPPQEQQPQAPPPQPPPADEAHQPPPQAYQPQPPPPPAGQPPPQAGQPPPAYPYQPPQGYQAPPPQWPGYPPWPQQAAVPPNPIESLQAIASSPGVHYVEIELSGELSIRGELRSVRIVPRP